MRNRIKCAKCGDIIESIYTHDFKWCKCHSIFVDGGHDYNRWGGQPSNIIVVNDDDSLRYYNPKTKAWDLKEIDKW